MNKMIFMNVGWMSDYSGPGQISGGGKYVTVHGYGHEMMNFKPFIGRMYGTAVVPHYGSVRLEKLGGAKNAMESITLAASNRNSATPRCKPRSTRASLRCSPAICRRHVPQMLSEPRVLVHRCACRLPVHFRRLAHRRCIWRQFVCSLQYLRIAGIGSGRACVQCYFDRRECRSANARQSHRP